MAGPSNLASGATASSKGTQPVCRLPLAAFTLLTSDVKSWRPAAVIQYDDQGLGRQCPCRPFSGASDHHHFGVVAHSCHHPEQSSAHTSCTQQGFWLLHTSPNPAPEHSFIMGRERPPHKQSHQCRGSTALLRGGHTPPLVMPISSPHEPASGGNENSPWGALPQSLLAPVTRCHHPSSGVCPVEFQAHHSRMLHMLACLPIPSDSTPAAGGHSLHAQTSSWLGQFEACPAPFAFACCQRP